MRALITGGGGFVGQWLARALLARGDSVDLTGLGPALEGPPVLTDDERAQVRWISADIRDAEDVEVSIDRSQPDVIFHLAGVAFPPDAERAPTGAYDVNALGAVRLLSSIRRRVGAGAPSPIVLIVGTGMQYGLHDPASQPLDESAAQCPVTTYAASKAAQEIAALQLNRQFGLRVICTRSFNHSGVGHGSRYLLPSLVSRVSALRKQRGAVLTLGNDVVRDYLHIDDVVRAYLLLVERGTPGEVYNVASGRGVSVRELASEVLLRAGVSADISTEAALVRASDIPVLVGSSAKLQRDTGWTPVRTHADIIDDLLNAEAD